MPAPLPFGPPPPPPEPAGLPSADDLDAIAEEQKIADETVEQAAKEKE